MTAAVEARDEVPSPAREAAVALVALLVAVLIGAGWSLGWHVDNAHNGLIAATFTAVGLYVLRVRPRHREGWLFTAVGSLHAVMFFGRQYGLSAESLPAQDWIGWLGVWPLPLAIALSGWALMAFPDGRLLSGRWRLAVAVMMAVAVGMAVLSALWPVEYVRTGLVASHPFDLPGAGTVASIWDRARVAYIFFQVLWTVEIVVRVRRAHGDETRQLRWLVYAVVMALVLLIGGLVILESPLPGLLAVPLIPVAAGLAILKYRLYDIDPVINKTLVVGAMLLVITAGYVAIVVGVGALLPAPDGVLTLLTTAVVAVVFEPLRHRAQLLADRLVYGHRPTPYEALSQLSAQLRAEPQHLLDGIAATIANAVGATEVVVWVGDDDALRPLAAWPAEGRPEGVRTRSELDGARAILRPVQHQGQGLGVLTLRKPPGESLSVGEERLLGDLVAQTALVILHEQHAEELQAAARRIVTAGDEARRRIERNLHDGAQQRLATLGLEFGALVDRVAAAGEPELAERMRRVREQLLEATAEMRELARGLHPSLLTQDGLAVALGTLADRAPIPVRLRVDVRGRLSFEIEATAYFLVSEALTNAARHADASRVVVDVSRVEDMLRVDVSDDGRGGARLDPGGGLQGLSDRLAALGASLVVESPVGGGTRIRGALPCA